jgi:hypothetical protein
MVLLFNLYFLMYEKYDHMKASFTFSSLANPFEVFKNQNMCAKIYDDNNIIVFLFFPYNKCILNILFHVSRIVKYTHTYVLHIFIICKIQPILTNMHIPNNHSSFLTHLRTMKKTRIVAGQIPLQNKLEAFKQVFFHNVHLTYIK